MSFSRLLIFMALALFVSCASDSKKVVTAENASDNPIGKPAAAPKATASQSIVKNIDLPNQPSTSPTMPPPGTKEPAQNADGVWHYTCAKGCPGGGAAATQCATCGEMLKHNSAYHGNPGQPVAQPGAQPGAQPANSPIQITPPNNTRPPEPAQNAAGVWHYTCAKGCAGGSGERTATCGSCGGPLAHNTVYHQ